MKIKTLSLSAPLAFAALAAVFSVVALADSAEGGDANILAVAQHSAEFSTLAKAVQAAGLDSTLAGEGPMTVFAPTDAAFAKLPAGQLEELLKPENKEKLQKILAYHVVPGKAYDEQELKRMRSATTAAGEPVSFALKNGKLRVDDARVGGEIDASNGVIVAIDRVLLPQ
jgi:uncharacterized surface protein with fasciclin (FAS1) repeats